MVDLLTKKFSHHSFLKDSCMVTYCALYHSLMLILLLAYARLSLRSRQVCDSNSKIWWFGVALPVTIQISTKTLLAKAQDEATFLVEWALIPIGKGKPWASNRLNCIHKRVVLLQPTLSCGHQSRKEYAGGIRHFLGYYQVLIPTVPYLSIECILVCKQKWQLQENHLTLTGESTLSYLFCFTGLPMHCPRFTSQTFMVLK